MSAAGGAGVCTVAVLADAPAWQVGVDSVWSWVGWRRGECWAEAGVLGCAKGWELKLCCGYKRHGPVRGAAGWCCVVLCGGKGCEAGW